MMQASRIPRFRIAVWLPAVVPALVCVAVAAAETSPSSPAVRERIDAIRTDLVELRFEKALAAIETVLADPSLSDSNRLEALILRAQAHGAYGDFDGAEEDYRRILRVRPAYVPETTLTPGKAMERFRKVRGELVGTARVTLEPPDAKLTVDGRAVRVGPDGSLPLLAGDRLLRVEAPGHDPAERLVSVEAGVELPVRVQLLRNSRTVVVRTEPEEVEVWLDGVAVGRTRRAGAPGAPGEVRSPAELRLENLPLGEHVYEFRKPCFAAERLQDMLTVDLMDASAKRLETVVLRPARSMLAVRGTPDGAEVRLDGASAGTLPLEPLARCPGEVELTLHGAGRRLWSAPVVLEEGGTTVVEVAPRPNAVLVGAERWPLGLGAASGWSTVRRIPELPPGDLERPAAWGRLDLPPDTDLAVAVLPPPRTGGSERWLAYSPLLQIVEPLEAGTTVDRRPRWYGAQWGMTLADSRAGGAARIVALRPDGPAARAGLSAGERVVAVSGRPVTGAAAVRAAMDAEAAGTRIVLQVVDAGGASRGVPLAPASSPLLAGPAARGIPEVVFAAWAAVEAADPRLAPAAAANLALLLEQRGRYALALDTWKRVRWNGRSGVGDGTSAYYRGRVLLRLGREDDAIEAFRQAAASEATAGSDDGPRVAPAARDRLIDLGVAPSATAR